MNEATRRPNGPYRGAAVRLVNEKHDQHLSLAAIFGGISLADKT